MTEEDVCQLGYYSEAHIIWTKAKQLCSGQTLIYWVLVITRLVTTKYVEDEDLSAYIAKIKAFKRDLILMQRDISDDLFACFLRISMPAIWNYVFASLSDKYTSAEVEHHIKNEYGIRINQSTIALA